MHEHGTQIPNPIFKCWVFGFPTLLTPRGSLFQILVCDKICGARSSRGHRCFLAVLLSVCFCERIHGLPQNSNIETSKGDSFPSNKRTFINDVTVRYKNNTYPHKRKSSQFNTVMSIASSTGAVRVLPTPTKLA